LNFAILASELKTPESVRNGWRHFLQILRNKSEAGLFFFEPESVNLDQCLIAQRIEALQLCHFAEILPQTEDALKINEFILQALEPESRINYLSKNLSGEMSIFKFKNPGSDLIDFLKLFSPRDVEDGNLSRRFSAGNAWEKIWAESPPLEKNSPTWDRELEAEKCLDFLENSENIFEQIFFSVTSAALQDLENSPGFSEILEISKYHLTGEVPGSNPSDVFFPSATLLDNFLEKFAIFEDNAQTAAALSGNFEKLLTGTHVPVEGAGERAFIDSVFSGEIRPWMTEPARKEVLFENKHFRFYAKIRGVRIEAGLSRNI